MSSGLRRALEKWRAVLGSEAVITDPETLRAAEATTFAISRTVLAIIRPADRHQVQQSMKIACEHAVCIYPVSKGRNWGLGSRVPTSDACVLMELGRMNKIVDFDEELAYITVEPGVTFHQTAEFLKSRGSRLFITVTGGPPDSSLIGNALERGDGIGPYGDRFSQSCSMEVVLPSGECIHTGFERFSKAKVSRISREAPGPSLEGLFSQSSLGIVTQMTFWLMQRPQAFQSFLFTVKDRDGLRDLIDKARALQAQGVFRRNSLAIWNVHKMVASERQYPWELTLGQTPLSSEHLQQFRHTFGRSAWIGAGALYAPSKSHAMADRRLIKRAFNGKVDRLVFLDQRKSRVLKLLHRPLHRLTGIDIEQMIRSLYTESVFLGFPTERSTKTTYWRKKSLPKDMDPDRDQCGVIWLCPVMPFSGSHVIHAVKHIERVSEQYGFEPQIAFIFPSERAVYMFPSIIYDREIAGEDERAMACHDALLQGLISMGYFPYRLGIQSMNALPLPGDAYNKFINQIKRMVDPQGLLSPGRYQFQMRQTPATVGPVLPKKPGCTGRELKTPAIIESSV